MAQATYKEIEQAIASRIPFVGNSASGYFIGGTYVVRSYSTDIAWYGELGWEIDNTKYSVTTSRLQNIVRKVWSI